MAQGGAYVNNERHPGDAPVTVDSLRFGRYLLLRRGRRDHALVVVADGPATL